MHRLLALLAVVSSLLIGSPSVAQDAAAPNRWLPDSCRIAIELAGVRLDAKVGDTPDSRWNRFYSRGLDGLETGDLDAAELAFCRALAVARDFPSDDIRFAETLDELGLVRYSAGDYDGAEAMQGAAVVEMLLAVGPPTEPDLRAAARQSCKSSVANYMIRLGWIFDRQGRADAIEPLIREPYRIMALGYVPDTTLVGRLDALASRYLLGEDFTAARWLQALRDERLSVDIGAD